jgi:hypothetical protein
VQIEVGRHSTPDCFATVLRDNSIESGSLSSLIVIVSNTVRSIAQHVLFHVACCIHRLNFRMSRFYSLGSCPPVARNSV